MALLYQPKAWLHAADSQPEKLIEQARLAQYIQQPGVADSALSGLGINAHQIEPLPVIQIIINNPEAASFTCRCRAVLQADFVTTVAQFDASFRVVLQRCFQGPEVVCQFFVLFGQPLDLFIEDIKRAYLQGHRSAHQDFRFAHRIAIGQ